MSNCRNSVEITQQLNVKIAIFMFIIEIPSPVSDFQCDFEYGVCTRWLNTHVNSRYCHFNVVTGLDSTIQEMSIGEDVLIGKFVDHSLRSYTGIVLCFCNVFHCYLWYHITTDVVRSNPTQARCTRYNNMWSNLSVTCGRLVVLSRYSDSTNKTECHDITEILLKVALNAINPLYDINCWSVTSLVSIIWMD